MKNFFKVAKVGLMVMVCALFLGIGIKADAALGKVANLEQTDDGTDAQTPGKYAVKIQWAALQGADGYVVEYCEKGQNFKGNTYVAAGTTKNAGVIGGLSAGTSYDVRVTAVTLDATGIVDQGVSSDVVEVVTAPSAMVSTLKQTGAQSKKFTVSWGKALGANVYNVVYRSYGSQEKGTVVTTPNDVDNCTVSVAADANYDVVVVPARKSSSKNSKGEQYVAVAYDLNSPGIFSSSLPKILASSLPKKITKVKFITSGSSSDPKAGIADFSWNPSNAADGYEYTIYGNNGKKLTTKTVVASNPKSHVTINNKKLKNANQFMKIRVRGYLKLGNKKVYGPYSDYCWFAKYPLSVKGSIVNKSSISDGYRISWKKMKGAKNYTVYIAMGSGSFKKAGTTTGTSFVLKSCGSAPLATYTTYRYRVVANKKAGKKTVKSDSTWSSTFRLTTTYYYY